jgi:hypothetical protein
MTGPLFSTIFRMRPKSHSILAKKLFPCLPKSSNQPQTQPTLNFLVDVILARGRSKKYLDYLLN